MAVLTWLYVRFSRTRNAWLPVTGIERRWSEQVEAAVEASDRYVLGKGQIVDTYRVWADWRWLRHLDPLPLDLTESRRCSALVALRAGLKRGEVTRLIGVGRATLRRWIVDDRRSDMPVAGRRPSRARRTAPRGAWGKAADRNARRPGSNDGPPAERDEAGAVTADLASVLAALSLPPLVVAVAGNPSIWATVLSAGGWLAPWGVVVGGAVALGVAVLRRAPTPGTCSLCPSRQRPPRQPGR